MKIERKTRWTLRDETGDDWCDLDLNIQTGAISVNYIRVKSTTALRELASALKSVAAEIDTLQHIPTAPALDLNGRPLAECNETNS